MLVEMRAQIHLLTNPTPKTAYRGAHLKSAFEMKKPLHSVYRAFLCRDFTPKSITSSKLP